MLEFDNGQKLMDDLWDATAAKVDLPDSLQTSLFRRPRSGPALPRQSAVVSPLLHARQSRAQARDVDDRHVYERRLPPRRRISFAGSVAAERAREASCSRCGTKLWK